MVTKFIMRVKLTEAIEVLGDDIAYHIKKFKAPERFHEMIGW
jgi:hypothetical protein